MKVSERKDDSRERFLIAAERLFMEHGYKGTTIRAICAEAGTSLAILNRNWPSKEALFAEMLKRHFDPLHEAQNRRFGELAVVDNPPPLLDVIKAFYRPAFARLNADVRQRTSIYSRALIDPSREIKIIVAGLIQETRTELIALINRALPGLDHGKAFLVMNVIFGAYVYPQAFGHQLASAMAIDDTSCDWQAGADDLATLLCNGLTSLAE
jgi:AcrR family transcriptional regulator